MLLRQYLLCDAAGYSLKLIMPANMSEERRACMAAYGAELITVPAGNMEVARDLAQQMQVLSPRHTPCQHVAEGHSCAGGVSVSDMVLAATCSLCKSLPQNPGGPLSRWAHGTLLLCRAS